MKRLLLSLLLSVVSFSLWAAIGDKFSVEIPVGGVTKNLWLEVHAELECKVIAPDDGSSYSGDYVIPAKVTNPNDNRVYTVTNIGDESFANCEWLGQVTIPSTVWTIEYRAFMNSGLTGIIVEPESENNTTTPVGWLGGYAFYGCKNLTGEISFLNNSCDWIREYAFYGCEKLTGITIPESVQTIDMYAFAGCSKLVNLNIPNENKINLIENNAFQGCNFKSITIPAGVTEIRQRTFYGCGSLQSISLPEGLERIGPEAFHYCTSLKAIEIPARVKRIDDGAIGYCSDLTSVTLHEGLKKIGGGAFRGCTSLKNIVIPQSATDIGTEVFNGCSSLTSVVLPEDIKSIEWGFFLNCSSLASIRIPETVTWIRSRAFEGCSALTSIVLPESVDLIDRYSFKSCTSLTSINFPASVNTIDNEAFNGCTSLAKIICEGNYPPNNCADDAFSGVPESCELYATDNYNLAPWSNFTLRSNAGLVASIDLGAQEIKLIKNSEKTESMSLTAKVTTRAANDLIWTSSDETVATVSDGTVTAVGLGSADIYATSTDGSGKYGKVKVIVAEDKTYDFKSNGIYYKFSDNERVTIAPRDYNFNSYSGDVVIPGTVTFGNVAYTVTGVGQYAFAESVGLTSVQLPNSVGSVDLCGFKDCRNLKSINFDNISWFGECAFQGCSGLTGEIKINPWTDWIRERAFQGCSGITSVVFQQADGEWRLKKIDSNAFQDCHALQTINIPNSVEVIENAAFNRCYSLQSINIPNGVTAIRTNTFNGCGSLTSVTIPESVTEIGLYAFGWTGLTSITIPGNVKNVVEKAFMGCPKLASVTIKDGVTRLGDCEFMDCPSLTSITLPNSVKEIGWAIFADCPNLESVVLPEDITRIPGEAFKGCSKLTNVNIPVNVTEIDEYAFQYCASLEEITIPKYVNRIGNNAFDGCKKLCTIKALNVNPPSIEASTFNGIPSTAKVGALKEVVEDYKIAPVWENYDFYALATKNVVYAGNSVGEESEGDLDDAALIANDITGENTLVFSTAVLTKISDLVTNVVALKANYGDCVAKEIALYDAKPFYCPEDVEVEKISYERNFTIPYWQALYMPFETTVDEWNEQGADIAYFNNVHQYDENDDGIADKTTIESFKMKSGEVVKANVPYFIKPREVKKYNFDFYDKKLTATPRKDGTITCSSTTMDYAFVGNYQTLTNLTNSLVLNTQGYFSKLKSTSKLSPFRMRIDFKNVSLGTRAGGIDIDPKIYISVDGVLQEETIFDLDVTTYANGKYFDLLGRPADKSSSGIKIINGKLILIK